MHWSGQHGAPSIDAIGHIGRDGKLFGGVDAAASTSNPDGIGASGVGAHLAIDQFPKDLLVNRGVLLDVATHGAGRPEPAAGGLRDHRAAPRAGGQAPARQGAGRATRCSSAPAGGQYFKAQPGALCRATFSPGPGLDAAEWLIKQGARIVGNDTLTFEKRPPIVIEPKFQVFPVHMRLIADKGIYIIENLDLEELAKAKAYEFAVVVPPIKVLGGTGSAVRVFALVADDCGRD